MDRDISKDGADCIEYSKIGQWTALRPAGGLQVIMCVNREGPNGIIALMDLKDRVVIVTGASSGIGLATAKLLSRHGAKVALAARSEDRLEKISETLPRSVPVPTDMSVPDQVVRMIRTVEDCFGRIDVLINNAGRGYDAPIEGTNLEKLQKIFDLDFLGPLIAMQQVLPIMKGQGKGVIVNISSGTAMMHLPNMGAYSAVKRALAHMSLTAREELKSENISVCVIYPYITLTDFEKNTIKDFVKESDPSEKGGFRPPPPDTADYVAEKIVQCVKSEEAEVYAHDWMKKPG
jgi:NAD(P)-dependent dehydrogenase (short-subunit alcohol dehydrogenase family)